MPTRKSRNALMVSSGSHVLNRPMAFSPAKTSYQATRRLPPYAFSTAASNTRTDAFQMSRPVPSPSMKGIMGLSGIRYCPFLYCRGAPFPGTATPLYEPAIAAPSLEWKTNHYRESSDFRPRGFVLRGGLHFVVTSSQRTVDQYSRGSPLDLPTIRC